MNYKKQKNIIIFVINMELVYEISESEVNLPIQIPVTGDGISINWGDGTTNTSTTHSYTSAGTYTITISGTITYLDYITNPEGKNNLTECNNFGNLNTNHISFCGCSKLKKVPDMLPPILTDLSSMFKDCISFTGIINSLSNGQLDKWTTTNVTNMSSMFEGCTNLVANPSFMYGKMDNVTNFSFMYKDCKSLLSHFFIININNDSFSYKINFESMFENCIFFYATELFSIMLSSSSYVPAMNLKNMYKNCVFNDDGDNIVSSISMNFQLYECEINNMFLNCTTIRIYLNFIFSDIVSVRRSNNTIIIQDSREITNPNNKYILTNDINDTNYSPQKNYITDAVKYDSNKIFTFTLQQSVPTESFNTHMINYDNPNTPILIDVIIPAYEGTYTTNKPTSVKLKRSPSVFDGIKLFALRINDKFSNFILCKRGSLTVPITFNLPGNIKIELCKITLTRSVNFNFTVVETFYIDVVEEEQPMICFKEGTKILTSTGYIPIERLRQGHFIKTENNYLPIALIGKKSMYHPAKPERIPDQLYKCSRNNYSVLFEDLVLTGKHSLLVDELSGDELNKTIKILGNNYKLNNKYTLPSCVDSKTTVYERQGNHMIYHLAIESVDPYKKYGIYANGLLVESCPKYTLQYVSDMEIITNKMPLLINV